MTSNTSAPLAGIRIVDLTSAVVGPYATQVLGDYGADVIKVEERSGDVIRWICGRSPTPGMPGKFLHLNGNKRSLCLDLKQEEGRQALLKLVDSAHVFLHNMRPAALARLGLDAETLCKRHPTLVHASVVGFGSKGRYAGRPAYDSILQGGTGLASLFASHGAEPRYVPYVVVDRTAGLIVSNAVLAALFARQRDGMGRTLEIPMFESFAALLLSEHMYGHTFDPPTGPLGDQRLLDANAKPVKTKDGYVCITTNTDSQVKRLFEALGRNDLAEDARYSSSLARIEHVSEFFAARADVVGQFSTDELMERLLSHDVPIMPCHTLESLLADPHLRDVGLIEDDTHPSQGRIKRINVPVSMSGFEAKLRHHAPHIGEQTEEVLRELGYSPTHIEDLITRGIARAHRPADSQRPT
ncbi:CaiB/BaiF CoA transferase family protein [Ottowia thiooxydans]|uniref:CaiB/BaiF CoA transferase family protein n=1 Tax=Ottowia thiooxydans TaxID=219182 RepID=UPI0003F62D24|nr:CoA transferase [Ottowia thiooxydans]